MQRVDILLGEDFDRKPEVEPSVLSKTQSVTMLSFYDSSRDTKVQFFKRNDGVCQFFMKKKGPYETYAGEISMNYIGDPTYCGVTPDGVGVRFVVNGQDYTISAVDDATAKQKWMQYQLLLIALMPAEPVKLRFSLQGR